MSIHRAASVRLVSGMALLIAIGLVNSSLRGQQQATENSENNRERLIVLTSGRIMTGIVTRNAGGYLIEQGNGRIQLPDDDVMFVVDSLRDAYRKQRDSVVEPTPATHLALANWCVSYRLYDEASDELKKCLKSDPENEQARRLLQRLTDTIRSNLPATAEEPRPRKTTDGFLQPDAESLGGLSRASALQFTRRIQPILMNKCGNASCHGLSSPNEFRIVAWRVGGHGVRQTSERNLAETLRRIDFDNPSNSQLLDVLQGSHGGKGAIFTGPSAANQMQTVRDWVRTVIEEKEAAKELEEGRVTSKRKTPRNAQAKIEKRPTSTIRQTSLTLDVEQKQPDESEESDKPSRSKPDPTDAAAMAREPEDAFDPNVFNQRFRQNSSRPAGSP